MGVAMSEIARASYNRELSRELDLRESEARVRANAAEKLERKGQIAMAEAIRDMWRHNEVARLRLQSLLGALFSAE
jgi:hypothetical protein